MLPNSFFFYKLFLKFLHSFVKSCFFVKLFQFPASLLPCFPASLLYRATTSPLYYAKALPLYYAKALLRHCVKVLPLYYVKALLRYRFTTLKR